ncbi:Tol biopolymer transport system component/imidazolonepropionase-like amidohydrolase [Spirosoma lacussanchae]|uniref:DPP IV N-terminal domain-containing protein n=1 Tax=Spirosoma lacussanchae TaxID=1884249 RepID=UPI0011094A2D|nr:DPP IV N-terminal domain-containing protein [Spirosoma lacussanchae]
MRNLLHRLLTAGFFLSGVIPAYAGPSGWYKADSIQVTVTEGTNMAAEVSPDKSLIAIDLQGTIWLLPSAGGRAKPLTDALGDCRQPSWSPDGKQIAFHAFWDGRYHIWIIDRAGGKPRQLTSGIYDDREPHWSPDGKRLVFASDRSGNYDIWQLTLADGKLTQLTTDSGNDYNPAYSPDGQQIAYISDRTDAPGIYTVSAIGGTEKFISASKGKLAGLAWQPDGTHLFYNALTRSQSGLEKVSLAPGQPALLTEPAEDVFPFRLSWFSANEYLYTADGLLKRRKLDGPALTIPFQVVITLPRTSYKRKTYDFDAPKPQPVKGIKGPAVSPDGTQIAFAALGDLWLLTKGNKKPLALTSGPAIDVEPSWSPDGTKLAYVSDRNGSMDVWIRDLKTGTDRCLVDMADDLNYPTWSPDGSKVAFYQADPRNAWGRSTLYTADVTYTADITVPRTQKIHESLFVPSQVSWSPDGKTLAVSALHPYSSRYREGVSEVLLISLDGKNDRYVSPAPGHSLGTRGKNGPVWSPDGTQMAYVLDGLLWVTAVAPDGTPTGKPRQLTTEQADVPSWTADSKKLVFLATDELKQLVVATGTTETIPMDLTWQPKIPASQLVIHAGNLFDGRSNSYLRNVDILVQGNRIKAILPHQANRPGTFIDASTKTVIPGLFEMHTHQHSMTGEKMGRLWLSYGITSVREPGADPYDALERKESWASGIRPGPRQFFTGGLTDGTRIYYGAATSINSDEQLDRELNRAVRLGYDLIKTYVRMPDAMQQRITAFAHANGIPVSSHEIFPAMRYDVDAVEHIGGTSRRGYSPKITAMNKSYQDVIQLIARSGMNITPTASLQGGFFSMAAKDPAFYENRQYKAFYSEEYSNALQAGAAQMAKINPGYLANFGKLQQGVKALIDAGAHMTTGTDSPFVPYGYSLHTELQSFVDAGLTPYQALRCATLWAAETVGVSNDLGTVEPGKLADLVIVDGDPLGNIRDVLNVDQVIRNGDVLPIAQLLSRP